MDQGGVLWQRRLRLTHPGVLCWRLRTFVRCGGVEEQLLRECDIFSTNGFAHVSNVHHLPSVLVPLRREANSALPAPYASSSARFLAAANRQCLNEFRCLSPGWCGRCDSPRPLVRFNARLPVLSQAAAKQIFSALSQHLSTSLRLYAQRGQIFLEALVDTGRHSLHLCCLRLCPPACSEGSAQSVQHVSCVFFIAVFFEINFAVFEKDMHTPLSLKDSALFLSLLVLLFPSQLSLSKRFSNPCARVEVYLKRTLHVRTLPCAGLHPHSSGTGIRRCLPVSRTCLW